jgi:hypothetical protein
VLSPFALRFNWLRSMKVAGILIRSSDIVFMMRSVGQKYGCA